MSDDTREAVIKLSDFGLSKVLGPKEMAKDSFGTLSYASPEVLQNREYGKEIDLWGLGVIAFSLATGVLPFDEEDDKLTAR